MNNHKAAFSQYIQTTNISGSGKAKSYIRALDLLSEMLLSKPFGFTDCKNIWSVNSLGRIHDLYQFVLEETRKKEKSEWNLPNIPKSYLQNGYCSAALKAYESFLVEHNYEQGLLDVFNSFKGDEDELSSKLDLELENTEILVGDLDERQGKDVIRSVKVRANQNVFRKMILKNYNQSCCITGLNIPKVNRASHIIPWAEDESKRLDPRNGLCLSATYDAAFDEHLISLDDDYRIILSKGLRDYYDNECVKTYFLDKVWWGQALLVLLSKVRVMFELDPQPNKQSLTL